MRISDWSSDVCSSDLLQGRMPRIDRTGWCALEISRLKPLLQAGGVKRSPGRALVVLLVLQLVACATGPDGDAANASTITGHEDRKRVLTGRSVSVRVDLGGHSIIKQKRFNLVRI